jgi:hypothetical protein
MDKKNRIEADILVIGGGTGGSVGEQYLHVARLSRLVLSDEEV